MQTTRPKPVAECMQCGKTSVFTDQISKPCYVLHDGIYCRGIFVRRLRVLDWASCSKCIGTGLVEGKRCSQCNGDGWIKGTRMRTDRRIKPSRHP
jgi:hypothetical protein